MELRIVGTNEELADFLKALGTGKVVAKAIKVENPNPKKSVAKPKKSKVKPKSSYHVVTTTDLAKKYDISTQAIRMYAKAGMPHMKEGTNLKYNEVEASAWIEEYMATHKCSNRGMKYGSRSPKSKIKKAIEISDYTKWRRNISEICKNAGVDEGKMLSLTYKYMTKNYGIVWEQLNKEFYQANNRRAMSTLEVAYALEQSSKVYTNLLVGCLDTVIKESK